MSTLKFQLTLEPALLPLPQNSPPPEERCGRGRKWLLGVLQKRHKLIFNDYNIVQFQSLRFLRSLQ